MSENVKEKKPIDHEKILEIIVAVFLALTALCTAWASWIGSLHGGNQATNYTKSSNVAADGNARWNEASQKLMQDMVTWNSINEAVLNYAYAERNGNTDDMEKYEYQYQQIIDDNCSESFQEAINWAFDNDSTPFAMEGYVDSYYTEAQEVLDESEALLEQGKKDNQNGDTYGLVTVIYSVVLFLLGIVGTFKSLPNRRIITCVAIFGFIVAFIFMLTVPMPTGFNLFSYFAK